MPVFMRDSTSAYLLLEDALPPRSRPAPRPTAPTAGRWPDALDVHLTAQVLTVSADTVSALLQRGGLPGRTGGRQGRTTTTTVLQGLEQSAPPRPPAAQASALARACPREYRRASGGCADGASAARHKGLARRARRHASDVLPCQAMGDKSSPALDATGHGKLRPMSSSLSRVNTGGNAGLRRSVFAPIAWKTARFRAV
jgi:hypothetical protein